MINYGIHGPAINWFKSYSQGRSQFVTVDTDWVDNVDTSEDKKDGFKNNFVKIQ